MTRLDGRSLVSGLALLAILAGTVPDARAQDTTRVEAPRPMVPGGVDDKPYMTTLLGRTALGGYAEAHARLVREDGATAEAGFEAKRFNLFTSTEVSDFVRIGAEIEIEEGGEEVKLEFAAIDVAIHPALRLRAGMILSPLGRFNLSHDSPRNEFTDRPLVSTELLGVALSEPGLGVFGTLPMGASRLTYELYAVNGFGEGVVTASPDGTRIPAGRQNFEDENARPALVGRVAFSPALGYELGLSGHHGPYNVYVDEGVEVDERRDLSIWVVDLEAGFRGLRIAGEAALARVDLPPGLVGLYASDQNGLFLEALYDFARGRIPGMPSSFFTVGLRGERVDFDADAPGDDVAQLTLGLNFRPTPESVLKLDFTRGRSHDAFSNPADHAALLFSVATYF